MATQKSSSYLYARLWDDIFYVIFQILCRQDIPCKEKNVELRENRSTDFTKSSNPSSYPALI